MNELEFVEVYRAENGLDAHLLKSALDAAGISAQITDESMAALRPNLWWAAPRVLVDKADAERAATIVGELNESRAKRASAGPGTT